MNPLIRIKVDELARGGLKNHNILEQLKKVENVPEELLPTKRQLTKRRYNLKQIVLDELKDNTKIGFNKWIGEIKSFSSAAILNSPLASVTMNPNWLPFIRTVGMGELEMRYHSFPNVRITDKGNRSVLSTTGLPRSYIFFSPSSTDWGMRYRPWYSCIAVPSRSVITAPSSGKQDLLKKSCNCAN